MCLNKTLKVFFPKLKSSVSSRHEDLVRPKKAVDGSVYCVARIAVPDSEEIHKYIFYLWSLGSYMEAASLNVNHTPQFNALVASNAQLKAELSELESRLNIAEKD